MEQHEAITLQETTVSNLIYLCLCIWPCVHLFLAFIIPTWIGGGGGLSFPKMCGSTGLWSMGTDYWIVCWYSTWTCYPNYCVCNSLVSGCYGWKSLFNLEIQETQKHAPFPPHNDPNSSTFKVPILNNNSDCQVLTNETIQSSMLCAGGEGRGTNKVRWEYLDWELNSPACSQGDSGGPLTVEEGGVHTLEGITSHGLSTNPLIKVDP